MTMEKARLRIANTKVLLTELEEKEKEMEQVKCLIKVLQGNKGSIILRIEEEVFTIESDEELHGFLEFYQYHLTELEGRYMNKAEILSLEEE